MRITQGHPLAVNLEGVIVDLTVPDARRVKHALVMEKEFTLGWLKALNVKLAGLANNHALDGGETGLARTTSEARHRGNYSGARRRGDRRGTVASGGG